MRFEDVTIRFPESPILTYVRYVARWHEAEATILQSSMRRIMAEACDGSPTDVHVRLGTSTVTSAVLRAIEQAIAERRTSIAPTVTLSRRDWLEWIRLADWMDELRSEYPSLPMPQPDPDMARLIEAAREAIEESIGGIAVR